MSERTGLRARLASGPPVLATFVGIPRVEIVEIAAAAGFDAVVLDREHGSIATADLVALVAAAQGVGLLTVVRVPAARPDEIGAALDTGADGVLVPHVGSAATAALCVAAARFAPEGERGVNPYVRAGRYGVDPAGYLASANAGAAVIAMIEGRDGVEAASEIVRTPGLDAVFVGPYDLSAALGMPGRADDRDVLGHIEVIAADARLAGIAPAVFAGTPAAARAWLASGIDLVALSVDSGLALDGFRRAVSAARPAA